MSNKNTKLLQYFGIGLTLFATLGGLYLKYLNLKNIIQPVINTVNTINPLPQNLNENELFNKLGNAIPNSNTIINTTKELAITSIIVKYGVKYLKVFLNLIKK
jgi:hypothetical protein